MMWWLAFNAAELYDRKRPRFSVWIGQLVSMVKFARTKEGEKRFPSFP